MRVETHRGYDSFVLVFNGPVPRYEVLPQGTATFAADTGGGTARLQGSSGLLVRVYDVANRESFAGPSEVGAGYPVLEEARHLDGSGDDYRWALGLSRAACFRVTVLDSPSRLVIDIES